jgi:hypothetical protein
MSGAVDVFVGHFIGYFVGHFVRFVSSFVSWFGFGRGLHAGHAGIPRCCQELFKADKWVLLARSFATDAFVATGLGSTSALWTAVSAGLTALRQPYVRCPLPNKPCHVNVTLSVRLTASLSVCKLHGGLFLQCLWHTNVTVEGAGAVRVSDMLIGLCRCCCASADLQTRQVLG